MIRKHNIFSLTRRRFLGRIGGAAAAAITAGVVGPPALALGEANIAEASVAAARPKQ